MDKVKVKVSQALLKKYLIIDLIFFLLCLFAAIIAFGDNNLTPRNEFIGKTMVVGVPVFLWDFINTVFYTIKKEKSFFLHDGLGVDFGKYRIEYVDIKKMNICYVTHPSPLIWIPAYKYELRNGGICYQLLNFYYSNEEREIFEDRLLKRGIKVHGYANIEGRIGQWTNWDHNYGDWKSKQN